MRAEALIAFVKTGGDRWPDLLARALDDPEEEVHRVAAKLVESMNGPRAIEALIGVVEHGTPNGRTRADSILRGLTNHEEDSAEGWQAWWKLNRSKYCDLPANP